MNTPLLNATIEIVEMSDKKGQYGLIKKIKGKDIESGQTNTYTVYDKKKDGSISAAWSQIQSITVGDTVQVGYAEQQGTMDDGKPFTSRIVRNFNKDIGNGVRQYQSSQPTKSPNTGQNTASQSEPRDYEKEAYVKCCSIWAAAHIQAGKVIDGGGVAIEDVLAQIQNGQYWSLFQAIKADGEKRFAKGWAKAEAIFKEELPTITQEDDPAGDFNPMVNDTPPLTADDLPPF
jgi:hypothetical protein